MDKYKVHTVKNIAENEYLRNLIINLKQLIEECTQPFFSISTYVIIYRNMSVRNIIY